MPPQPASSKAAASRRASCSRSCRQPAASTKNSWPKGYLQDLFEAGAIVVNPGCGGCAEGHVGLTGRGEVQISTGNRNFSGKQGKGQTYLAGPAVVAASCVLGHIAGPEDLKNG